MHGVCTPIDARVMLLQPINAKNNIMRQIIKHTARYGHSNTAGNAQMQRRHSGGRHERAVGKLDLQRRCRLDWYVRSRNHCSRNKRMGSTRVNHCTSPFVGSTMWMPASPLTSADHRDRKHEQLWRRGSSGQVCWRFSSSRSSSNRYGVS